jgi:hypothetical protein
MWKTASINDVDGKEKYCVEVYNIFAVLEDLDAEVEMNTRESTLWTEEA